VLEEVGKEKRKLNKGYLFCNLIVKTFLLIMLVIILREVIFLTYEKLVELFPSTKMETITLSPLFKIFPKLHI
jgi:hypothetical protein